jgi:hypothetical protein
MLHRAYLNMIRRAQLSIDAGGNHFHHLLWWCILSAFGCCINFCIYSMLRTRATFSWPILYTIFETMIEWRMHCDLNLLTLMHLSAWLSDNLTAIIRSLEVNFIIFKRAKQCTYNVTLRRVRSNFVAVEKQHVLHHLCVCVCVFVTLVIQHATLTRHTDICGLPDYTIFPHYGINGTILEKKMLLNIKWVIFSTNFVLNSSHSKKNWERYDKKMYISLHVKYPFFLSSCNESWIFSTDFREILIFHDNSFTGSQVVPWWWTDEQAGRHTDRHDETNSRFLEILRKRLRKGSRAEQIVSSFFMTI